MATLRAILIAQALLAALALAARAQPQIAAIAHRGNTAPPPSPYQGWPENTLPAFESALEMGADYVEVDVRTSRDGYLVRHSAAPPPPQRVCPDDPRLPESHLALLGTR